jgi:hypothetical protein
VSERGQNSTSSACRASVAAAPKCFQTLIVLLAGGDKRTQARVISGT